MKKFLSVLLTVVLALTFSLVIACGNKPDSDSVPTESSSEDVQDSSTGGGQVEITYQIIFVNEDGTVLQTVEVKEGVLPEYTGETPSKPATAEHTFTFAGWDKQIANASENTTYTATYSASVNQYLVKFVNEDGTVLQEGNVAYGEVPAYRGTTPSKAEDENYTYVFEGWDKQISAVTGEVTYTATFTAINKENANDDPYGSDIY